MLALPIFPGRLQPSIVGRRRNDKITLWSGKPFSLTSQEMMEIFLQNYPEQGLKSVGEEIAFYRQYWARLLLCAGVSSCLEERAEEAIFRPLGGCGQYGRP